MEISSKISEKYELLQHEFLKDTGCDSLLLVHKKTGARVALLPSDDDNKVFYIGFRTPPKDSTGVAHIIEHTVLCGSRAFPVKDPFVELVKGSLNTFLNAMTYPDKTMYPVASTNDADFRNLMNVYLDAVFYPNIYREEKIFRQEGWHYEMESPEDDLTINGVVYNEMKGAFSSADEYLERVIFNGLFPDTSYGVESGGDPKNIPDLTYEQFLNFHSRYYHPSNSYIYLYGDMDMADTLAWLDEKYLSAFEKIEIDSEIKKQAPFAQMKRVEDVYPIADEEDEKENTYLAWNVVTGDPLSIKEMIAYDVLDYALLSMPGAPVREALLEAGIGRDVTGAYNDGILQPYFSVEARGAEREDADRFEEIIRKVLTDQAEGGIDKKSLMAGINYLEFQFREADYATYPKGLMYSIDVFDSWLYDENAPFVSLKQLAAYEELRHDVETGYFEKLIKEVLLDNAYRNIVVMEPTASEKKYAEPTEEPDGYSAENRRAETDPTPHLNLSDIDRNAVPYPTEKRGKDGTPYLYAPQKTDGIVYADLFFDISQASEKELFHLSILASLLTSVATLETDGAALQTKLGLYTGSMDAGMTATSYKGAVISALTFRFKALASCYAQAVTLAEEVLTKTVFDDQKAICDLIDQIFTDMQLGFINNSSQLAATRAAASHNVRDAIADRTGGLEFYQNLKELREQLRDDESAFDRLKESLENVYEKFFKNGRAVFSLSCDEDSFKEIESVSLPMQANLTDRLENADMPLLSGNVALTAPCDIVFNGYSFNIADEMNGGALLLAKKILSLEYLWQKIRVENGAYGCGTVPNSAKRLDMWSYRDPQIGITLNTFKQAGDFLSSLQLSDRAVEDYIISVIRSLDNPQLPRTTAYLGAVYTLLGRSYEDIQKERDELLSATLSDLNEIGKVLQKASQNAAWCTVGNPENITANKALYDEIITL